MMTRAIGLAVAALIGTYYLTTFSIWLAHWLWHRDGGPQRGLHAQGHHRAYPPAGRARSASPIRTPLKYNGLYALLPCLVQQELVQYLILPPALWALCLVQALGIVMAVNFVHAQCHLAGSRLERFRWFARARDAHDVHHQMDANYMVGDHFWDRRFGTYGVAPGAALSPRR
jgi:sterol desaturase/sphingolipid hydroxylase (fatty acid hydroxylase superfamily)